MKCHECGKEMLPDAFGRRVDGSPSMEGFSGYDAGEKNNQGEITIFEVTNQGERK